MLIHFLRAQTKTEKILLVADNVFKKYWGGLNTFSDLDAEVALDIDFESLFVFERRAYRSRS